LNNSSSEHFLLEMELPAKLDNLYEFMAAVTGCVREQGVNPDKITNVELALEEVLVNIFNYAYQDGPGNVGVVCFFDAKKRFIIRVDDRGVPFNPLSVDEPDLTADVSERKVGGLGIYFAKTLLEDVQYLRKDNKNILTLTV
jgi:serine/threonine-protein kinase RsbW